YEDPVPSLSVAAFAAYRHFDRFPIVEIDPQRLELRLRYRLPKKAGLGEVQTAREIDRIPLFAVHKAPGDVKGRGAPRAGFTRSPVPFQTGDIVAHQRIFAESPQTWRERTIPYEDVLTADERQIQRWFDRKAVLIGQMRP